MSRIKRDPRHTPARMIKDARELKAKLLGLRPNELCIVCLNVIHVMCFKNTDFCSELCRKQHVGEESKEMAVANK